MDEDLNENELEERLYAMLHHVDETQANVTTSERDAATLIENAPTSNLRRYWRTGEHSPSTAQPPKPTPKETLPSNKTLNISKPKEEKSISPTPAPVCLSIFQTIPQIINKTIEILDHENPPLLLESSDEDEVIEVAIPPKPTITIESSDEDDICIVTKPEIPVKHQETQVQRSSGDRDSTSPVPSVVSSVSDEFIRGDCIALNISSRHPDNHNFDFSLHGSDLLGQTTPTSKRKRKKKSKEVVTSTPEATTNDKIIQDECFATPRSKVKHKKQKKSYTVSEKSIPNPDVYDSDSNQSVIKAHDNQDIYIVTEKTLPSTDVYESDSNQSETVKENLQPRNDEITKEIANNSDSNKNTVEKPPNKINLANYTNKSIPDATKLNKSTNSVVDLTENDDNVTLDETGITESIVMGNVIGFKESSDYEDDSVSWNAQTLGSTKIPPILYDNLDFDNLKGKEKVCKKRRYSLTTLRAEMEKFYNESWGGEEFNHREIQKYMSRDKSLWVIDPKDRMQSLSKRKLNCHYCNRPGHRDDMCRLKPTVCYMCGCTGHNEPRCPTKMCVNCGSPNYMYSTMCRNCSTWHRVTCAECGQHGHPASHCPDTWRRYHNTIDMNTPLEENRLCKRPAQLFCSGCTRRGHLVHTCRITLPFSGLPMNSPYVSVYRPLYLPAPNPEDFEKVMNQKNEKQVARPQPQDSTISSIISPSSRNKRQSKSPGVQENQRDLKKKKHNSISESELNQNQKNNIHNRARKMSTGKENNDETLIPSTESPDKLPDFIPLTSTNRDKKGQMIQDNEVSDTSEAITLARIYATNEIIQKLKTADGKDWLEANMTKFNVTVCNTDVNSFLSIKGKVADQEAFQTELKNWATYKPNNECSTPDANNSTHDNNSFTANIPKSRSKALLHITRALESLKNNLGDPKEHYEQLTYLQTKNQQLLKQKVISPTQLTNNRHGIRSKVKALNMLLLGQAGLADGPQHIERLYFLQQTLRESRQKVVPNQMRKEIGQHYNYIFTAMERDDYLQLLQIYSVGKSKKLAKKKSKSRKKLKFKSHTNGNIVKDTIPPLQSKTMQIPRKQVAAVPVGESNGGNEGDKVKMLIGYHKQIRKTHPEKINLKKQKRELIRKLHTQLIALNTKKQFNAKCLKKMDVLKAESHRYLNEVNS